ncbi:insulinase family protein [Octadecabacter sp. SW4]|mgnify:CR=1 FL=1|uniref:M16 family metallopeptidase n=1 Tax=Octadecabacter sp. SW4 TaxID=2602067 RepID=UPI0011C1D850|nr:pitrilysin family protein [Octadecabacter sp. SW4]QEE36887.1 insulinase family protein [Octadecabacter sp. SW4]|tara:strand:- start:408 stop:1742 length:1335 start_codon:yes stop_codon:yes gene_type:complete
MLRALTAVFALLTSSALYAQEVTTYTLDNGMDVVVIEDHRAPVVVQMVWYRIGSADEPVGASGVAHFLEHLLFKETENMASGEMSATVAANGGSDNAFTSYDYTAYYQRVAADRLELMMRMESDRMNNLRITEADIETERNVVLEERAQRTDNNAGALAREQMRAAQYMNHRYGVPIIGWRHEMEDLSLQDALDFYDLYYSPNNAILVVAGDVQPDEVLALAEQYYGVIPAEPDLPERLRPEEPPQNAERRLIFEDPRVAQPYITRSYLAPERDSGAQEDAAALVYLADIIGGSSFTSVLGEALQFDTQTAVYTGAGYDASSLDDTTFGITVVPAVGVSLQDSEDAMDAAIAAFMETGVDPDQLERLRTQFRASEIYARDNVEGIANRYGAALTQGLTVQDVQDWPDILQAVTADDIMAVAAKVLDRKQSVTGWVIPNREALTQ